MNSPLIYELLADGDSSSGGAGVGAVMLILMAVGYFIPTIIAATRHCAQCRVGDGDQPVPRQQRSTAMRTFHALLVTATAVALINAPAAYADPTDDQYLALLSSNGITGPPDVLIADAHETCDAFSQSGFGFVFPSPRMFALAKLRNDLIAQEYRLLS